MFEAFVGMDARTTEEQVGRGTREVRGRLLDIVRVFVSEMGWVVGEEWEAVKWLLREETEGSGITLVDGEVGRMVMRFEI